MCGILGWIPSPTARLPLDAAQVRLDRALGTLVPRGPDSEGRWHDGDGAVWLGHRRLAIVGAHGAQPLFSEDRRFVAVVNGEFYDHRRLRADLERRGHTFRTDTDSEVLVHLVEELGQGALEHLIGEFAFAVWDRRERSLWLARDRFGIKPLRVVHDERGLAFASEAKALFELGWTPRWNAQALADGVSLQYVQPGTTWFDGIGMLEAAESQTWTYATGMNRRPVRASRRYWTFMGTPESALRTPSPEEAAERIEALLARAVDDRLQADVPVAVHLSGGLDSSSVLAQAARIGRPGLTAFSVSFDNGGAHDEIAIARRTATALDVPLVEVPMTRTAVIEGWEAAVGHTEGWAINGHLVAKWHLNATLRAHGFKVALSGEGADEALIGYPHFRADGQAQRDWPIALAQLNATNQASRGLMMPSGATLPTGAIADKLGFVPTWIQAKASLGHRAHALLNDAVLGDQGRLATQDPYALWSRGWPAALRTLHPVHAASRLWAGTALSDYILRTLGDGVESAHGIEGRVPFLDHRLVQEVQGWAPEVWVQNGVEKAPLRQAMAQRLPDEVVRRQKHPFLAPALWGDLQVRRMVRERLLTDELERYTPFSLARVSAWLDGLDADPSRHTEAEPVLLTVLSCWAMGRRYRMTV